MNVLVGFVLYLLAAFTVVALALFNIIPTNYLGGFVIAGFIGGLVFAWLNAWHQGDKMSKTTTITTPEQEMNTTSKTLSTSEQLKNYPCMKEIMTGTREGDACVYSADCELAPVCSALSKPLN